MQTALSRFEYRRGLTDVATESGAAGAAHVRQVVRDVVKQMMAATQGGTTAQLSRFAALTRYDALPDAVVLQAKQSILDTLGAALAGSGVGEGCNEIVAFASEQSEGGPAMLWASGERLGTAQAALANAAHARALDYDDIIAFPQVHVAVCVVPAVFAVSQSTDAPVSGKAFLAAVAVGCEIQSRLASAIALHGGDGGMPRMLSTQLFGYFSAAAACGNLLGLDPDKMASAFGLALMQAAGTEEMVVHAAESVGKCLYAGFSNQGGLNSALMARRGVVARGEPFDGKAGLFAAYYEGRYDSAKLTAELGRSFASLARCFKTMPGTLVSHAFAEAAMLILREQRLTPAEVERVRLHVGPWGNEMCEPAAMRRRPPSASAAMNSIPFIVAKAIVNGKVALDDFGGEGRSQSCALETASRVDHVLDPRLANPGGLEPGVVELTSKSGATHSKRIDRPHGHPLRPVGFDDVADKFRDNADCAARPLEAWRVERIIDHVRDLEDVDDMQSLVQLIGERGKQE
jgi:2-methylcitrate dehydratase PrpD